MVTGGNLSPAEARERVRRAGRADSDERGSLSSRVVDARAVTDATLDVERTAQLVHDAARRLELTAAGFRLLRVGNHIVMASLDDKVVARVRYLSRQPLEDHVAHHSRLEQLAAAGAPFVAPLCDPCRLSDGRIVTFWPMQSPAPSLSLEALVELAWRCHRIEASDALPVWDPEACFLTRWTNRVPLMEARGVPARVRAFLEVTLHRRLGALSECWADLGGEAQSRVLIHGDVYSPNVVCRGNGTLAFVDLDSVGIGPPEVDLSTVRVQYQRHDQEPHVVERIRAAYNGAVNERLLAEIYATDEINELVWLACLWGVVPGADQELIRRVDHWDDPTLRWQEF